MRKLTIATLMAASIAAAGCAGLNASGVLTITYNTPAATAVMMTPGAPKHER